MPRRYEISSPISTSHNRYNLWFNTHLELKNNIKINNQKYEHKGKER